MNKLFLVFLASIFVLTLVSAQNYGSCPMGGMMYGQYGLGLGVLSWITYLLVIVLIIAAIYWLIKSANRKK